jgi:hypothetical protein
MADIAREQIAEPTLRPDGRQSVGFGIYNRLRLNGYFVPNEEVCRESISYRQRDRQ